MSMTTPNVGSDDGRHEGRSHGSKASLDPSFDAGIASDSPEEGEVRDEPSMEKSELQDDKSVEESRSIGERHPVEEGRIQDSHTIGEKRKRSTSDEDELPLTKRSKPQSFPAVRDFQDMRTPSKTLRCIISVDEGEIFGSLYTSAQGLSIMLYIDPGCYGDPKINLNFKNTERGLRPNVGSCEWDMRQYTQGQYGMDDVKHMHARTNGPDPRASNPEAIKLCSIGHERNLVYFRFKSWAQRTGWWHTSNGIESRSQSIQESLKIMFEPKRSYILEIWFIAPIDQADFRRECLKVFTHCLNQRVDNSSQFRVDMGNLFNDVPKREPSHASRSVKFPNSIRQRPRDKPKRSPNVPSRGSQHTFDTSGTKTGGSSTAKQELYPTPGPQLAIETLTARILKSNTPPPAETQPTAETKKMPPTKTESSPDSPKIQRPMRPV